MRWGSEVSAAINVDMRPQYLTCVYDAQVVNMPVPLAHQVPLIEMPKCKASLSAWHQCPDGEYHINAHAYLVHTFAYAWLATGNDMQGAPMLAEQEG